MKVQLITSVSELPAHLAAAICVGKDEDAHGSMSYANGLAHALASGHYSLLEHIPFTWFITGVSRALTHQLVRHRIASYSQQSQRYCKLNMNEKWYIIPQSIENIPEALDNYNRLMSDIALTYDLLLRKGVKAEDARFVLPNACKTKILVSMNARAFIESATLRLCGKAQWEIQSMFVQMRETLKKDFPSVYKLAVPNCAKGGCKERKPCGKVGFVEG